MLLRAWADLVTWIPPQEVEDVLLPDAPKTLTPAKPESKERVVVLEMNLLQTVLRIFNQSWHFDVVLRIWVLREDLGPSLLLPMP